MDRFRSTGPLPFSAPSVRPRMIAASMAPQPPDQLSTVGMVLAALPVFLMMAVDGFSPISDGLRPSHHLTPSMVVTASL